MPTFTPITINDGADTPVAVTFSPFGGIDSQGVARFRENTGVPMAARKLSISLRSLVAKYKARLLLTLPSVVTETINGVDRAKVERVGYADVNFTFAADSTAQERKDLRILTANAILHSTVEAVVDDVDAMY